MKEFGFSEEDVDAVFEEANADGDALITFGEFLTLMHKERHKGGDTNFGLIAERMEFKVNLQMAQVIFYCFLLVTFVVLIGNSTMLFQFFKCRDFPEADGGNKRYLVKDYSIDCDSERYVFYSYFAMLMFMVYPIGIPSMYYILLRQHKETLSDPKRMAVEATKDFPTIGHLTFLTEAYTQDNWFFEVLECVRRLLLASVIGMVPADSAAAPTLGLIIALVFIFVFVDFKPFVDPENNTLGILLAYAVAFFFLGAILIKVDAAGESKRDQLVFEVILMLVMFTGPSLILLKAIYDEIVAYLASRKEKQRMALKKAKDALEAEIEALKQDPNTPPELLGELEAKFLEMEAGVAENEVAEQVEKETELVEEARKVGVDVEELRHLKRFGELPEEVPEDGKEGSKGKDNEVADNRLQIGAYYKGQAVEVKNSHTGSWIKGKVADARPRVLVDRGKVDRAYAYTRPAEEKEAEDDESYQEKEAGDDESNETSSLQDEETKAEVNEVMAGGDDFLETIGLGALAKTKEYKIANKGTAKAVVKVGKVSKNVGSSIAKATKNLPASPRKRLTFSRNKKGRFQEEGESSEGGEVSATKKSGGLGFKLPGSPRRKAKNAQKKGSEESSELAPPSGSKKNRLSRGLFRRKKSTTGAVIAAEYTAAEDEQQSEPNLASLLDDPIMVSPERESRLLSVDSGPPNAAKSALHRTPSRSSKTKRKLDLTPIGSPLGVTDGVGPPMPKPPGETELV